MIRSCIYKCITPLAIFLAITLGAAADETTPEKAPSQTEQAAPSQASQPTDIANSLIAKLDQIEAAIGRDTQSDQSYKDLRAQLDVIKEEATAQQLLFAPKLEDANARLAALQPSTTKEGEQSTTEADALVEQRTTLEQQIATLDGQVKLINASLLRVSQLSGRITLARQERFTRQLLERNTPIAFPSLWINGLAGLKTTTKVIATLFSDWFSFLSQQPIEKLATTAIPVLLIIGLVLGPLRSYLFKTLTGLANLEEPSSVQRSLNATWTVALYALIPVALTWLVILILDTAGLLPTRIKQLAGGVEFTILAVSLSYSLIRALLAPIRPNYRLLNIEDGSAKKLYRLAMLLLLIYGFETLFDETDEILIVPLETTILISGITAIAIAVLIWISLRTAIAAKPLRAINSSDSASRQPSGFTLPTFVRLLLPLAWLLCLVIAAAPFLGYVSLATFLAEQAGRAFVVLGILGILNALIDNLLDESTSSHNGRFTGASQTLGISTRAVKQVSVLFGGLVHIILFIVAALLIFAPWGVDSANFLGSMQQVIFNLQIGDLNISLINILGAIAVFIVTLVLVKTVQRWMESSLMPATSLDPGLKNSIQTGLGYVGFIIAGMLAFSYVGLDLSNIAIVAGALSVGIGFGLQSIVNNFVSGLILLAERPIKTGDWVVVGSDQGYVRKISVRATKIETFDRATVIVPNSDLISNRVMNWMHNGSMGRVIIPVGVSYDSDPEQVRSILLKIAEESELVSGYPEPSVYFMDFGASSLDFELRCYIQDINNSLSAKSALRFTIFKEMKSAGIEIPFPQQDIHIRSVSKPEDEQRISQMPEQELDAADTPVSKDISLQKDEIDLDDLAPSEGMTSSEGDAENG